MNRKISIVKSGIFPRGQQQPWLKFRYYSVSAGTLSLYHRDLVLIFDIPMHLLQNMQKGSQREIRRCKERISDKRGIAPAVLQRYCSQCVREILVYIACELLAIHDRLPRGGKSALLTCKNAPWIITF